MPKAKASAPAAAPSPIPKTKKISTYGMMINTFFKRQHHLFEYS